MACGESSTRSPLNAAGLDQIPDSRRFMLNAAFDMLDEEAEQATCHAEHTLPVLAALAALVVLAVLAARART